MKKAIIVIGFLLAFGGAFKLQETNYLAGYLVGIALIATAFLLVVARFTK